MKMNRLIPLCLAFSLLLFQQSVKGQFALNILVPPDGVYTKAQLLNLNVSYSGTTTCTAKVQVSVKSSGSGQLLFTAASASVTIRPGLNALKYQNLQPITSLSGGSASGDPSGLMPPGLYRVCYQLLITSTESVVVAAEDCMDINIQPMGPPQLVTPEDTSIVTNLNPSFTWLPPAPVGMFTGLNYDILVSEVHPGQSITDAIQFNLPLQQGSGLQQPFWTASSQQPPLEPGKKYAWQVIVQDPSGYVDKSEVWTFSIADTNKKHLDTNVVYLLLDDRANGIYPVIQQDIHVKYYSALLTQVANITILDEKGSQVDSYTRNLTEGDNYLHLHLRGNLQKKQIYTLNLTDTNNQTHFLHFMIL